MNLLQILALKALRNKKIRRFLLAGLLFLLLLPLLLLFMTVSSITAALYTLMPPEAALPEDIYYQAVQAVRAELDIANDFPVPIVKLVHFNRTGDLSNDRSEIEAFVQGAFVDSQVIEVSGGNRADDADGGEDAEAEETEPEYKIIYYFKDLTSLLGELPGPPFHFAQEDIEFIQALYFASLGGGDGEELPLLSGKYPMPVRGTISSGFGNRVDPLNGKYYLHPALDIVPTWHAPVAAIADGTVTAVEVSSDYGNCVTVSHRVGGDSFTTFYAHLSQVDVSPGQTLRQGDVIGLEGGDQKSDPNPGRTTGHHLHFELWLGDSRAAAVDPTGWLTTAPPESQE